MLKRGVGWRSFLACVGVTFAVVAGSAYYIQDRLGFLRLFYPLQAPFAKLQSRCSSQAPIWMEDLLNYIVDEQFSLANQIAYISPDGVLSHCESGWQKAMFRSLPVTPETRFRYASLSKLFTADAVLARVNSGSISLDSQLLTFIPETTSLQDDRLRYVTVEQLLRHAWGFDRQKSSDPMAAFQVKPWCPGDVRRLGQMQLDFYPGQRFAYSNLGYCLLGVVLERTSGKSFRALMEEEYGLGIKGVLFVDGPYLADEVGYDFRNSNFYGENYYRYFDFSALSSSAGLSGSATSLAGLIKVMASRRPMNILSANTEGGARKYGESYGFAVSPHHELGKNLILYIQSGLLFGSASKAVIDSEGGVTIWLGSGMALKPQKKSREFVDYLYTVLGDYYEPAALSE